MVDGINETKAQYSGKREPDQDSQTQAAERQKLLRRALYKDRANITKADLGVHPHLQANRSLEP